MEKKKIESPVAETEPTSALQQKAPPVGPYLEELSHYFELQFTSDFSHWLLRCKESHCDRSKKGWKLRRSFLTGEINDITKGDYNALMAHARAPHEEK